MTRAKVRPARTEKIDGCAPCFNPACGNPAGNAIGGPYSAFCLEHQPVDDHPIHGGAFGCAACFEQLGTLGSFDDHQEHYPREHPDFGSFTGVCKDPATLPGEPLIRDENSVWQTRAGLVKRARDSERLRAARDGLR